MTTSKSSPKTTTTTTDLRTTNTLNAGLSGDISDALVAAGNYGDTNLSTTMNSFTDSSDNSMNLEMIDSSNRSITDNSSFSSSYEQAWADNSNRSVNNTSSWSDSSDNSLAVNLSDSSNRSITDSRNMSTSNYTSDSRDMSTYTSDSRDMSTYTSDSRDMSNYQTSDYSDYSDNSLTVNMSDTSNRSVNDYSDNSATTITDGGAFSLVRDVGGQLIDSLGENQRDTFGFANSLVSRSYSSNDAATNSAFSFARDAMNSAGDFALKSLDAITGIADRSLSGAMQIKAGQTISEPVNQTMREMASTATKIAVIGGLVFLGSKLLKGKVA